MTLILSIETSCDETSVAIVENGETILSNVIASQVQSHIRFGGVVPEVASRHHVEQITQIIDLAMDEANISMEDIDAIAVTQGPGLVGALLIGITAAKTIAFIYQKPLIATNHLAGHIYASQLQQPLTFPLMSLIVSGGHTELVYMKDHLDFQIIGETQDDAVGEAYDKVGRLIGLPYPAGKHMDKLAQQGEAVYDVPRAMIHEENLNFSFSGMKSAVMNLVHNANQRGEIINHEDLATSFQEAVIDVLVTKVIKALEEYSDTKQFILAGGVAANKGLREALSKRLNTQYPEIELIIPPLRLCGDNAAMIGAVAYQQYLNEDFVDLAFNANPGLALSEN